MAVTADRRDREPADLRVRVVEDHRAAAGHRVEEDLRVRAAAGHRVEEDLRVRAEI